MNRERLEQVAAGLGIGRSGRHIFLCADQTNPKCCDKAESVAVWEHLKKRLAETGLLQGKDCVYRTKANCLRVCEAGPIAVVYPDGVWYHSVTREVADRIVDEHLAQGRPVEEFVLARAPLSGATPAPPNSSSEEKNQA